MKFILKNQARFQKRPEGINAWYYMFDEYHLGYCEQPPGKANEMHSHENIWETIMIIEGELVAKWQEDGEAKERIVAAGDVIEVGYTPHNLENRGDKTAKFVFIKQILSGEDKKEILQKDKILE
jgi:uncharacterized cupin superfamily protein